MSRSATSAVGAALLALALMLPVRPAAARAPSPLVTLEPVFSVAAFPQGQSHPMAVRMTIPKGFHINAHQPGDQDLVPTVLSVATGPGLSVTGLTYPEPQNLKLPFLDRPSPVYGGSVLVRARLTVAKDAAPGAHHITLRLSYQGCNHTMCLMPEEIERKVEVRVVPAGTAVQKINPKIFPH